MYCKIIRTANYGGLKVGQIMEITVFIALVRDALLNEMEMPVAEYFPCP